MSDVVQRLRENVIVDAFADKRLLDGILAERLVRERHEAADEIERLTAALEECAAGFVTQAATGRGSAQKNHNTLKQEFGRRMRVAQAALAVNQQQVDGK